MRFSLFGRLYPSNYLSNNQPCMLRYESRLIYSTVKARAVECGKISEIGGRATDLIFGSLGGHHYVF